MVMKQNQHDLSFIQGEANEGDGLNIKGMQRDKKLQKKKAQMKVNSAGLKKQILPLLGEKAKMYDPKCINHKLYKCGNEPGCRCRCHDGS